MNRTLDFLIGVPAVGLLRLLPNPREHGQLKKILIIKLAAAGDTILLFPALKSLRKTLPSVEIHWLVSPINKELATLSGLADKLWVLKGFSFGEIASLVMSLRKENYSAVADLEQWARGTAILARLTNAPIRVGFNTPGQFKHGLFTKSLSKSYTVHENQEFLNVLNLIQPLVIDRDFGLRASETGNLELQGVVGELGATLDNRLNVLLHPGCGSDGLPREWPLENYAVLANWLMQKYGARIFLSGGPDETAKTGNLRKLLNKNAVDMGGRLTWAGTIALVSRMHVVVSGNTGLMHLAAALGRPQIALHGPTNPVLWGPLNMQSRVIQSSCPQCPSLRLGFEYHAKDQSCMRRITVDEVKNAVRLFIDKP